MTTIHFLGLFTVVVPPSIILVIKAILIIVLPVISWMWFSIVAVVFSLNRFRQIYVRFQKWIDLIFGTLMITLGLKLMFSSK
ncbi:MAG: LysE family transporter [Candidatus Hodarchaeota archaeon]